MLIYEGPGQGDTLRVHNYAFIPQWDRVMKAVYDFAASSELPWDRSRGVGHRAGRDAHPSPFPIPISSRPHAD